VEQKEVNTGSATGVPQSSGAFKRQGQHEIWNKENAWHNYGID